MDNRAEVREFLISRRAKVTPQQAGLPDIGARRVPGLRRGEVAALAGVSIEYYAKLERGALAGVSASVLDAIARRPAARRRRTGPPVPPRPRRRRHQRQHAAPPPPSQAMDTPAQPAMGPRQVHRTGDRPQRPDGPARRQPPRPRDAHMPLRVAGGQPNFARYTFLTTPPRLLPRLGHRRRHLRRDPAHRSRPRPARQGAPRPRRRAVHPQRGLPTPVELTQRPAARRRHQAVPPPPWSATSPRLRKPRHGLRTRPHAHHLCRRTSLANGASPCPARLLDDNAARDPEPHQLTPPTDSRPHRPPGPAARVAATPAKEPSSAHHPQLGGTGEPDRQRAGGVVRRRRIHPHRRHCIRPISGDGQPGPPRPQRDRREPSPNDLGKPRHRRGIHCAPNPDLSSVGRHMYRRLLRRTATSPRPSRETGNPDQR